jgi:hypothetical protein
MDPFAIAGLIVAGLTAGIGLRIGARLLPIGIEAYQDLQALQRNSSGRVGHRVMDGEAARGGLPRPALPAPPAPPEGRRRESSIVGFYEDCLRHTDGAYTRLYEIELEPTMLAEDAAVERRCDDFARMLCADMPVGTMIQVRYNVGRDPGLVIAAHLRERRCSDIHLPAAALHDLDLAHYHTMAQSGSYRCEKALLAIRVPAVHAADPQSRGLSAFLPDLFDELGKNGIRGFLDTLRTAPAHRAFRGVVDRIRAHEAEAFRKAELIMRRIEMECPVALKQLTGRDLWEAIYRSHNLDATVAPNVNIRPGDDLRDYLCGDSIEYRDGYALHGSVPVGLVSMFVPPDGGLRADSVRLLTARADLTFPHTICAEYIAIDPDEAKKQLVKRAKQVEQETRKADGKARRDYDAGTALSDIDQLLAHMAASRDALVQCRYRVVVHGDPIRTQAKEAEAIRTLEQRIETIESALKRIEGADVRREKPASLRCLYPGTILGELSPHSTWREMREGASSLAALAPLESAWQGSAYPHSTISTVSGRLVGLNLWDKSGRSNIKSPLTLILGEPGSGKSTFGGMLITDALATMPYARVQAVDFDESLAPLADALGARYFKLNPEDERTINIWDSPELAAGEMPDEETITLILMDTMLLAGVKDSDERSPVVLTKAIRSVLKNFVPRNGGAQPKREPTLKHLVAKLKSYQFDNERDKECAEDLASKLENYVGDPWLDAPTHPDFDLWSPFDVYELGSLEKFTPLVRQTLANRIATRVIRSIGKKDASGDYTPTLIVFDEAHLYPREFPGMMKVIGRGARQGRKSNVVTCVLTHTYDDFEGIHDITATAGVKVIGLQTGNFTKLVSDANLSERAVAAINAIRNRDGMHAEFVLVMGSGAAQQVEMIQVSLSPVRLWIHTTNPQERNTRSKVMRLTGCSTLEAAAWLAGQFPRGLLAEKLLEVDEDSLKQLLGIR